MLHTKCFIQNSFATQNTGFRFCKDLHKTQLWTSDNFVPVFLFAELSIVLIHGIAIVYNGFALTTEPWRYNANFNSF